MRSVVAAAAAALSLLGVSSAPLGVAARSAFAPTYTTLPLPTGANLSCLFAGVPWSPDAPVATPVILFLHGWPEGSWAWAGVMATGLLDSYVLVAPDQRGYNRSSLMATYALDELVRDATALAAALSQSGAGAARPVHWVAHDWGGAVAWAAAAADDAGAIASLTMVNMAHPLGWISEIRNNAAQQDASAYVLSFVNPAFPTYASANGDALLKSVFAGEPWWAAAQAAYVASWAVEGTVNASLGWYRENVRPYCNLSCTTADCWKQGVNSSFDHLAHGGVTRASLRVRVLWGLLDTAFDSAGQLAFLPTVVRGPLNITTFPDNGHWLANEDPNAIAAAIAGFIIMPGAPYSPPPSTPLSAPPSPSPPPPPLVPPRVITYASLNVSALRPAPLPYDPLGQTLTWSQTSSCCGYGPFTAAAVAAASAKHGVFEASAPCGWPGLPAVGEWGYEFHNNQNNIFPLCGNLTEAGYAAPPRDREEALARLNAYWICRAAAARAAVNASAASPVFSMIGHYLYAGLSAAVEGPGRIIPGTEVGETINSIQLHIAVVRGAARQLGGAPIVVDFSAWFDGYILDYSDLRPWGTASSPTGGHSLQLFRRAYFTAFCGGASGLIVEAGAVNAFLQSTDGEGVLELSPLGSIVAEVFAYTRGMPSGAEGAPAGGPEEVRGIPYVPLALLMEQAHGMGLGWFYANKSWDAFPLSDAEQRVGVALEALWPGSLRVQSQIGGPDSEAGFLVPAPMGDLADVLLPANLTAGGLAACGYRALWVAGLGAPLSAPLAAELGAYVLAGGTLILGADEAGGLPDSLLGLTLAPGAPPLLAVTSVADAQTGWRTGAPGGLSLLPCASPAALGSARPLLRFATLGGGSALAATVNAAGAGSLVLLLSPGAGAVGGLGITQHLLSRLRDDTSPVALASNVTGEGPAAGGGVQSMLARAPWGWLLTLVNNRGVTKQPNATAEVDASQGRAVTVTLLEAAAGAPLASAFVRDGARAPPEALPVVNGSVVVELEPGGLRVVGLVLQQ